MTICSLINAAKKVWLDGTFNYGKVIENHRFHHVSTDETYGTLSATGLAFTERPLMRLIYRIQ
tara:strand:- start:1371 stop:1559 length:189 start_codon:yes stop_codon:yes gene_type:complete